MEKDRVISMEVAALLHGMCNKCKKLRHSWWSEFGETSKDELYKILNKAATKASIPGFVHLLHIYSRFIAEILILYGTAEIDIVECVRWKEAFAETAAKLKRRDDVNENIVVRKEKMTTPRKEEKKAKSPNRRDKGTKRDAARNMTAAESKNTNPIFLQNLIKLYS